MRSLVSENVEPQNHRFYKITQTAYIIGATGHVLAGINFWRLEGLYNGADFVLLL